MNRIIALDLDGTLLNSRKELSEVNRKALQKAAMSGAEIVPTTGRFYLGIPEVIRELDFVNYVITINGAQVYDIRNKEVIYRAEIPYLRAVEMMQYMDTLPVIYDCFMDDWGWMTRSMYLAAEQYVKSEHTLNMIRNLRNPVDDLKTYISQCQKPIQKIQMFFQDETMRIQTLKTMPMKFPDMAISQSIVNNIEINCMEANKGAALLALCNMLQIPIDQTIAFGDCLNDICMLQMAGVGVAMGNGNDEVKAAANCITDSCDNDGVAQMMERLLFEQ